MVKSILNDTWLVESAYIMEGESHREKYESCCVYTGNIMRIIEDFNIMFESRDDGIDVEFDLRVNGRLLRASGEIIAVTPESVKDDISAGGGIYFQRDNKKYRVTRISNSIVSIRSI